jgi:hypothetical protein
MPSSSRALTGPIQARYKRGVRSALAFVAQTVALALLGSLAAGCTAPQSGSHAATWCVALDGVSAVVDDMEDGNGALCLAFGGVWQVTASDPGATVSPAIGALTATQDIPIVDLPADGQTDTRGIHFTGTGFTAASGTSAFLSATFASVQNLSAYSKISFWATTSRPCWIAVDLLVGDTAADGVRWATPQFLSATPQLTEIQIPLASLNPPAGSAVPGPVDATQSLAVEFEYAYFIDRATAPANPADGAFDLWIDDVSVTP